MLSSRNGMAIAVTITDHTPAKILHKIGPILLWMERNSQAPQLAEKLLAVIGY